MKTSSSLTFLSMALLAFFVAGQSPAPRCCWSKWGDKNSCGWYPSGASGGRCNTDPSKTCNGNAECPATPPTPPPAPKPAPAPAPPKPSPSPSPSPPTPPGPAPNSTWVKLPETVLAFYYFVDDCPDARMNIPAGMLTSGNAIFLSFIADDVWDEQKMNKGEVAAAIKKTNPDLYIAYSVGGEVGSSSQSLYTYLSSTPEDTIVQTILGWKYADGIDWDLEPPSGGVAAKYGTLEIAKKLVSISTKVRAGGKGVSMAGFGAWSFDGLMSTLNGEFIISNTSEMFGIMVYPPEQGTGEGCIKYYHSNWEKGAQAGKDPAIRGKGTKPGQMAGGLAGPASVAQAVDIATAYHGAGFKGAIVWMVKPDKCSNTHGWITNNADLPKWTAVLDALKGKNMTNSKSQIDIEFA